MNSNEFLFGILVLIVIFCVFFTGITLFCDFIGQIYTFNTKNNVIIVDTQEYQTFKTYSCIRVTKVK